MRIIANLEHEIILKFHTQKFLTASKAKMVLQVDPLKVRHMQKIIAEKKFIELFGNEIQNKDFDKRD